MSAPAHRIPRLTAEFYRSRLLHAPPGSTEDWPIRRAIAELTGRAPLPETTDELQFRTPIGSVYARRVIGTSLVLLYRVEAPFVDILVVKPAAW